MDDLSDLEKLRANMSELEIIARKGKTDALLTSRVLVLMAKMIVRLCEVNRIR